MTPSAMAKSNFLGQFYQVAVKFSPKNIVLMILPVAGEQWDSLEKHMPEPVAATHVDMEELKLTLCEVLDFVHVVIYCTS